MCKRTMIAAGLAMLVASGLARADNPMKVCGARYQAAKTAGTLPAGETWNQFLAQCRGTVSGTAAVSAKTTTPAAARLPAAPSAAMAAMHDRQRKCGQLWQADKAAGRVPAGQTWPGYWSACNTRLKG